MKPKIFLAKRIWEHRSYMNGNFSFLPLWKQEKKKRINFGGGKESGNK